MASVYDRDGRSTSLGRWRKNPPFGGSAQEECVRGVVVLARVVVAEPIEKLLEVSHLGVGHFEASQHASEIRTVISIVEQADVPAATELLQKLHQRTGTFGAFEPIEMFVLHVWSAAA